MEIQHLLTFTRSAHGLLGESDIFELELSLLLAPESGALIPGSRGLRKIRRPLPGRGKTGGARVIYYYVASDSTLYLVFVYAKGRQADLTKAQLHELAKFVHSQIP